MVMKLTKELFENVIAYVFSEPGAMGAGGFIECLNSDGDMFSVCYLSEETSWEKIKANFDGINACRFNGPHKNAFYSSSVLRLGGNDDVITTIKEGWREVCFDCGHHFVCKEEYARVFIDFFEGMSGCEIICEGMEKIKEANLVEQLDSIRSRYLSED